MLTLLPRHIAHAQPLRVPITGKSDTWSISDPKLETLTMEELKRFRQPGGFETVVQRYWYTHGFLHGLYWDDLDEQGLYSRVAAEGKIVDEIMNDLAEIYTEDIFCPEAFMQGLGDALKQEIVTKQSHVPSVVQST